jgi:sigma-B regulation protein RsbU (phosphoserine phosphatase)
LDGGVLGRLIYGDEPVVIDHLEVGPDDPAAEYFAGMGSLAAIPLYDQGVALNMVVLMRKEPGAFRREFLPEHVWMANLFGRATSNLALSDELRRAYEIVDRELKAVEDIQRSLLPSELPRIPTLQWAAHYQTSRRAGGDYYDFFPLPNGQWGILIADVSGHGTPAAVLMAITHSIAHTSTDPKTPPSRLLAFVNDRLAAGYTGNGNFITAFYGIYDPATRRLTFSSAGHPWPRVCRAGSRTVEPLTGEPGLPLGIEPGESYADTPAQLHPGDTLVLYTDGITEARSPDHDLFGERRLDESLVACDAGPDAVLAATLASVERFTGGAPPTDDRTLLVARVS